MSQNGPIIIIENDEEDQELFKLAIKGLNLKNKIHFFNDGNLALEYLKTTRDNPFFILSDLKMPRMNGLELRSEIEKSSYLKKKSISFIFISEIAEPVEVNAAYELGVQGFFTKPNSIEELEEKLKMMVGYWQNCVEPILS